MNFSGVSMEISWMFDAFSMFNVSPMDFYMDSRLWIFDGNFMDFLCIYIFDASPMDF